jgi:hypothetical protein
MSDNLPGMESSDSENPTPVELDADSFDQLSAIRTELEKVNERFDRWEKFLTETVLPLIAEYGPIAEKFLKSE